VSNIFEGIATVIGILSNCSKWWLQKIIPICLQSQTLVDRKKNFALRSLPGNTDLNRFEMTWFQIKDYVV
jgi:hypothetical protein